MPRKQPRDPAKAERATDRWLAALLKDYVARNTDADIQLGDLAMHEPHLFWRFLEIALDTHVSAKDLAGLGCTGLHWLLRWHPDMYDAQVAGLARRDPRIRELLSEVDSDRIAPDVWRKIEAASG